MVAKWINGKQIWNFWIAPTSVCIHDIHSIDTNLTEHNGTIEPSIGFKELQFIKPDVVCPENLGCYIWNLLYWGSLYRGVTVCTSILYIYIKYICAYSCCCHSLIIESLQIWWRLSDIWKNSRKHIFLQWKSIYVYMQNEVLFNFIFLHKFWLLFSSTYIYCPGDIIKARLFFYSIFEFTYQNLFVHLANDSISKLFCAK